MIFSFIYKTLKDLIREEKSLIYRFILVFVLLIFGITSLLAIPIFYRTLVVGFLGYETLNSLFYMISLYVICWATSQIYEQIQEILFAPIVEKGISVIIRSYYLQKLVLTSKESSQNTADDVNALTLLSESWSNFIFGVFLHILPLMIQIIFSAIFLYQYCGVLYAFVFLGIFVCFWGITSRFTHHFVALQTRSVQEMSNLFQFLSDRLYNLDLIRVFAHKTLEMHTLDSFLKKAASSRIQARIGLEKIRIHQSLILALGILAILLISTYNVLFNKTGGDHFILVNAYLMQVISPLSALSFVLADINHGFVGIRRCYEKMDPLSENKKVLNPTYSPVPVKHINLEHVDFRYENSDRMILRDLCLNLYEGQNILIVGQNGSGKSTLGKILTGLIEPNCGIYTINDQKTTLGNQSCFQPHISYVSQTNPLLNDTIRHNLCLANQKATLEEMHRVLDLVGLLEFINSLPQGIDTHVGEFGSHFSGGERQRISIARALLRNFSLGIFDEVTANLHTEVALKIARELTSINPQAIKIFITHSPEYFSHIAVSYELKNGQLNPLNLGISGIKKGFSL